MNIRIPTNMDGVAASYLRDLNSALDKELAKRTPDVSARDSVLITSPDKSIWKLEISNAGVVSATKVQSA